MSLLTVADAGVTTAHQRFGYRQLGHADVSDDLARILSSRVLNDSRPNVLGVVMVYVTLTIPQVILLESFLSFLGLGIQEPMTSWGMLINDGAAELEINPRTLIIPASFMTVTLFCFNFLGDGLRDALDPKDR